VTWATLEAGAPDLTAEGRRLIYRTGGGEVLLATVRADEPPRIHPITVDILDGQLYAFILSGPKRLDLERDGRYAMHAQQDPAAPSEFSIRGRARLVTDPAIRGPVASVWSFDVDDGYALFAFDIESAILGRRAADEWPPRYESWKRR